VYVDLRVLTPLSVAKGRYAFADFHDIFPRRVSSRRRSVFFLSDNPEKYRFGNITHHRVKKPTLQ
jgi:hypothetical protein